MGAVARIRREIARDKALRARLLRDSAWIFAIAALVQGITTRFGGRWGVDSHAYWDAWHGEMYTTGPNTLNAYLYSPAFAQLIWPISKLGWPAFAGTFSLAAGAALAWLLAPLGWRLAVPLWVSALQEIVSGNIFVLLALVVVLGFRLPGLWAVALLTKITLGLGPLWFLARGEWRRCVLAALTTSTVALVSFSLAPDLWLQWFEFLVHHVADAQRSLGASALPPLTVRAPLAVLLLVWGAYRQRPWVLPISMVIAAPVLWLGTLTLLAALPRLTMSQLSRIDAGDKASEESECKIVEPDASQTRPS